MDSTCAERPPRAAYVVPLVVALIAATQMAVSLTTPLSSWKGGGYGMFGTTEQVHSRFVACRGWTADGRKVYVDLAFDYGPEVMPQRLGERLRCFPTQADVDEVCRRVMAATLVPSAPGDHERCRIRRVGEPPARPADRVRLTRVEVQVFVRLFDRDRRRLYLEPRGPRGSLER